MESTLDIQVKDNLALVSSISKKFLNRGYEYDDIFQTGCIGLIKAIKDFDSTRGFKFSTYAFPRITGEIKRFLRDDGIIRVSRNIKLLGRDISFKITELYRELGREPTYLELAEHLDCTEEEISEAVIASSPISSLDNVIHHSKDGIDICLQDVLKDNLNLETEAIKNLKTQYIMHCINKLPENERKVILLRLEDNTQKEIAKILNTNQVQVSRVEKSAHKKLKILLNKKEIEDNMSKKDEALRMFAEGKDISDVMSTLGLTKNSARTYKSHYNSNIIEIETQKKEAFNLFRQGHDQQYVSDNLNISMDLAYKYKGEFLEIIDSGKNIKEPISKSINKRKAAFELFKKGMKPSNVAIQLNLALSTAQAYKSEFNTISPIATKHAPVYDMSEQKKANKIIETEIIKEASNSLNDDPSILKGSGYKNNVEVKRLLKPVLFEGEFMKYKINEDDFEITLQCGSLLINKNNLDSFISELQELKQVM